MDETRYVDAEEGMGDSIVGEGVIEPVSSDAETSKALVECEAAFEALSGALGLNLSDEAVFDDVGDGSGGGSVVGVAEKGEVPHTTVYQVPMVSVAQPMRKGSPAHQQQRQAWPQPPPSAGASSFGRSPRSLSQSGGNLSSRSVSPRSPPRQPKLHPQAIDPSSGKALSGSGGGSTFAANMKAEKFLAVKALHMAATQMSISVADSTPISHASHHTINVTATTNMLHNTLRPDGRIIWNTAPFFNKHNIAPRLRANFGFSEGSSISRDQYIMRQRADQELALTDPIRDRAVPIPEVAVEIDDDEVRYSDAGAIAVASQREPKSSITTRIEGAGSYSLTHAWRQMKIREARDRAEKEDSKDVIKSRVVGSMSGFYTTLRPYQVHRDRRIFGKFPGAGCVRPGEAWEEGLEEIKRREESEPKPTRKKNLENVRVRSESICSAVVEVQKPKKKNIAPGIVRVRLFMRSSDKEGKVCEIDTRAALWEICEGIRQVLKLKGEVNLRCRRTFDKIVTSGYDIADDDDLVVEVKDFIDKATGGFMGGLSREPMSYMRSVSPANFGLPREVSKLKHTKTKKKDKKKNKKVRRRSKMRVEYDENGHKLLVKNLRRVKGVADGASEASGGYGTAGEDASETAIPESKAFRAQANQTNTTTPASSISATANILGFGSGSGKSTKTHQEKKKIRHRTPQKRIEYLNSSDLRYDSPEHQLETLKRILNESPAAKMATPGSEMGARYLMDFKNRINRARTGSDKKKNSGRAKFKNDDGELKGVRVVRVNLTT